jgi:hypothetical protein
MRAQRKDDARWLIDQSCISRRTRRRKGREGHLLVSLFDLPALHNPINLETEINGRRVCAQRNSEAEHVNHVTATLPVLRFFYGKPSPLAITIQSLDWTR